MPTVILANGRFPTHQVPLNELKNASRIICCDGSAEYLINFGLEPYAIIGDLDSVSENLKAKFADRLFFDGDQSTNDLTKTINWCKSRNLNQVSILAGTGKRDDHTLGNIGLLPSYQKLEMEVKMVTDFGTFVPLLASSTLGSFKGQQVSIFSFNNSTVVSTKNLKYPINSRRLIEPWMGTLNISLGSSFDIEFDPGPLLIFRGHKE